VSAVSQEMQRARSQYKWKREVELADFLKCKIQSNCVQSNLSMEKETLKRGHFFNILAAEVFSSRPNFKSFSNL
jgi:hypothetical protein